MGANTQTRWRLEKRVGHIVLDNPPMNGLTDVSRQGILQALDEFRGDGALAVVITGAGDRAFCGGTDLEADEQPTSETTGDSERRAAEIHTALRHYERPVIAAVNGCALGGGLALALGCDIRLGSTRARIGAGGVEVGLIASSVPLRRLLPAGRARDLLLTGRTVEADEAHRLGLLSRVVAPEALAKEAEEWAQMIAERAPLAVARAKAMINVTLDLGRDEAEARERDLWLECERSHDHHEAIAAFFAKRKPVFEGR